MSIFSKILVAAAPSILGTGIERVAEYGTEYFGSESGIGSFLSKFGPKVGEDTSFAGQIGSAVASAISGDKGLQLSDMPSVSLPSVSSMAAARMQAAGQAARVPLGSGNRVPDYISNSGRVKNMLSRVQTIPIPRPNIPATGSTISLASSKVTSRRKRTVK